MGRKTFTDAEIRLLSLNANVLHVSEKSITYAPAFKLAAVQAYLGGMMPQEIFFWGGFELDLIGRRKPKACLKRWRDIYAQYGEAGLLEERRGFYAAPERREAGMEQLPVPGPVDRKLREPWEEEGPPCGAELLFEREERDIGSSPYEQRPWQLDSPERKNR
ncbi:hypothetical protein F4V43_08875 [Paenibacillus spiritus]|uniref:Uncharacterized protein n=1 Tax=Paenibacillus spiritus TaxID=2496557 RepID=A0A5J5GB03_9BACL|nr:hypothetical protein [Paenibacillus spiritus]KAA9005171.1 hypothetical protein F4V43_08875 [Paenibacillus spiritus]